MKYDKDFSPYGVCPATKERLTVEEHNHSNGICPRCGDVNRSSVTHVELIAGKWLRPSLWEWLKGKRKKFVPTDEL